MLYAALRSLSMPRQVDHAQRRDLVARVAADLVAAEGVDALTVRRVAEAAGHSTTVVSHYFADRRDLVLSTYRAAAARSAERFDQAWGEGRGRLTDCLEALLPLDEQRRRDWRTWFAFWAMAVADAELAAEQDARVTSARSRLVVVLARDQSRGTVRAGLDLPDVADDLLVLVHGLGTQAVFGAAHWTPVRQRRAVSRAVAALGVAGR